jgi:hypothetical protein
MVGHGVSPQNASFALTIDIPAAHFEPLPGGYMAKGDQRKEKMAKKPKKDTSPPKTGTSDRPMPPVTTVIPRGKIKTK